jgi:hypothetical protein
MRVDGSRRSRVRARVWIAFAVFWVAQAALVSTHFTARAAERSAGDAKRQASAAERPPSGKNSAVQSLAPAASAPERQISNGNQLAEVDRLLLAENAGKTLTAAPPVNDQAFLRRLSVDLIGRIPTEPELRQYLAWPAAERRGKLIDRLLAEDRFTDRWTVFFADLLRIRSDSPGGDTLMAFVHQALEDRMPYDVMCRQLISANGKAGKVPQVGFILGDNADPLAMAGVTAQVFMGIRVSCAQCHDHPFDVWTREQFYGLAAYYGRTRRIESQLTKAVYTTEGDESIVLWPPEDVARGAARSPMKPSFPFELADDSSASIARLNRLRQAQAAATAGASQAGAPTIDDLLAEAGLKAPQAIPGQAALSDVTAESQRAARALDVQRDLYRESQLRNELADCVTSPQNRFFSRALVNRLWAELLGRGIVEPVDDFNGENPPSHPQTLDYLADEFVAAGFDLRAPIRLIVASQAYARGHLSAGTSVERDAAEKAFVAAPVRRMLSEALFDSVVQAGHLFEVKHSAGENMRTITTLVREAVPRPGASGKAASMKAPEAGAAMAMSKPAAMNGPYDLESAIELNFDAVLAQAKDAPEIEPMTKVATEDLEESQAMNARVKYVERKLTTTIDDNPRFTSAMRMVSPAPAPHFLRIFGQTSRDALGDVRQHNPSMRQALMMLNGRLTNEAARVGRLEPIQRLLVGPQADTKKAIRFAYREILTREPASEELAEAGEIVAAAATPLDGMADLRWALFNCHEFRYLP